MTLTPIKVRGKRGQPKAANHGKRPNTNAEEVSNGDDQLATRVKRAKTHHKDKPELNKIPQEILERIFVASENLALSLVNHELYRRLSSNSVKYQLVGAAFGPTWDAWYGLDNDEVQSYCGWMSDAGRIAGDPALQSAILACSWATLPLLLESFEVWIRQHANGRPYFVPAALDGDGTEGLAGEEVRIILGNMKSKFRYDTEIFASRIAQHFLSDPSLSGHNFSTLAVDCHALLGQHLEVNPGAMIPDDLLAGPVFHKKDDGNESEKEQEQEQEHGVEGKQKAKKGPFEVGVEKFERLFWLVRGGACLQEEQTWEASRDGFLAILELIKEVAARGKALDFHGVDTAYASAEGILKLAAGVFQLFNLLGVFSTQWPKYILQTSLTEVSQLIPTVPGNSLPELLLGNMAAALRDAFHNNNATSRVFDLSAGHRWRRPAMRLERRPNIVPRDYASSLLQNSRSRVHYEEGWQRTLYLDAALARVRQQRPGGGGEGGFGSIPRKLTTRVYRRRFIAYLRAVGANVHIVGDRLEVRGSSSLPLPDDLDDEE